MNRFLQSVFALLMLSLSQGLAEEPQGLTQQDALKKIALESDKHHLVWIGTSGHRASIAEVSSIVRYNEVVADLRQSMKQSGNTNNLNFFFPRGSLNPDDCLNKILNKPNRPDLNYFQALMFILISPELTDEKKIIFFNSLRKVKGKAFYEALPFAYYYMDQLQFQDYTIACFRYCILHAPDGLGSFVIPTISLYDIDLKGRKEELGSFLRKNPYKYNLAAQPFFKLHPCTNCDVWFKTLLVNIPNGSMFRLLMEKFSDPKDMAFANEVQEERKALFAKMELDQETGKPLQKQ